MPTFKWKGEDLGEFDEPTFNEIRAIKKYTGMFPGSEAWEKAQNDGDPDCLQAIIFLLLHRNGRMVKYSEVTGKPSDFETVFSDEERAEQARQAAEKVAPVTRRILERVAAEAGVPLDLDDDEVLAIVQEELERTKDEQADEGKDESDLSTPTTSSADGQPDSGTFSA